MSDEDKNYDAVHDDYDFDIGRVSALLSIPEKVASVAPGFVHISTEAMSELRQINEELRVVQEARAKREAEKVQAEYDRAQREAAERAKSEEAAQATTRPDQPQPGPRMIPGQPVEGMKPQPSKPADDQGGRRA